MFLNKNEQTLMPNIKSLIFISILTMSLTACDSAEKREFMNGCRISVRNSSICSCTWNKMTEKYSPKMLKSIGEGRLSPPADFQQQMAGTIRQCMAE